MIDKVVGFILQGVGDNPIAPVFRQEASPIFGSLLLMTSLQLVNAVCAAIAFPSLYWAIRHDTESLSLGNVNPEPCGAGRLA